MLLLDFMRLYGRALNNIEVRCSAVCCDACLPDAFVAAHGCLDWLLCRHPPHGQPCSPQLLLCQPGPQICTALPLHSASQVGISCRKGGSYFNKRNKGFFQASGRQHQAAGDGFQFSGLLCRRLLWLLDT